MESLAKQLDTFLEALLERVDPATAAVLERAENARAKMVLVKTAVGKGDVAPDFTLPDQHGNKVSLHEALTHGPVVLTFFRGGWCPFCSLALRAIDRILPELTRAGASLLAVSPQSAPATLSTVERNTLHFPVLSDRDNEVARRYGLVWELDPDMRALYQRLGHDLPRINGVDSWELPIAAGYVIGRDGRVALAHVDPRTTSRLEPKDALEAVCQLQVQPAK
ncbi:peroxiredoxin-like family protein [Limobrevibacterium gyesilva]|uniref:thioredoxin-dependent peroxiredoxin n=1 Tax=Limobrevibacterium gyesilva TaxID=2991712 RepID=A0AA42CCR8_9PROT|nr:peroxiredoxin-like family protein [Limobrevibacterium gyesilva]MCW3473853.1 AhpC/TSA family protein [Limobrevibacterium gyesilva]